MGTHPIFESDFDCLTDHGMAAAQQQQNGLGAISSKFLGDYKSTTPLKLKCIDAYLTYCFFTGVIQFVYCCLVGTFPFNAFLAGFISCVFKSTQRTSHNSRGTSSAPLQISSSRTLSFT